MNFNNKSRLVKAACGTLLLCSLGASLLSCIGSENGSDTTPSVDSPATPDSGVASPVISTEETSTSPETTVVSVPETTTEVTTEEQTTEPTPAHTIEQIEGIWYADGVLIANKTYPLPADYNPGKILLQAEIAFKEMQQAASRDGITLTIVSGFRSYSRQDTLYNKYVAKDGKAEADRYSARPGHSEHQSGLAMDLNSVEDDFAYTKEAKWIAENCAHYGFIIRYPQGKEAITGYIYEPWHVRYVGVELAEKLTDAGLTMEEYFGITSEYQD